jgi:hypothetical protein
MSDYRRGLVWWLDLLTTLTHDSWLHFIIHSYTHIHTYTSVLTVLLSPIVVNWYRILPMEILQLRWSRRCPLANTPHLNSQLHCGASCIQDNSSARTTQKAQLLYCCGGVFTAPIHSNDREAEHKENTVLPLLRALPSNSCCLQSHCLATGLYATICIALFLSSLFVCVASLQSGYGDRMFLRKSMKSIVLQAVTTRKTVLFTVTAVRTSNIT